ncbi:hypothetical protein Pcar_3281 [Syntrophotalea carbinolica DSM 2380]|uniref:Uncharacterized protein n=1 Tax=Syntrophotalea carbinolica (strain DSM 2380 / NBRC 103641 / GraBd1) TaxID=338963 RepID=Q0C6N7_SYNC1|nr:hypothetical protein Pcar_3281 [Syntrophotalea carbinolica DSM 2380]
MAKQSEAAVVHSYKFACVKPESMPGEGLILRCEKSKRAVFSAHRSSRRF